MSRRRMCGTAGARRVHFQRPRASIARAKDNAESRPPRTGEGINTLLATVADLIEGKIETKPLHAGGTPEFQRAVNDLVPMIEKMTPGIPNARWLAIRLLDGDARVQRALVNGELVEIVNRQKQADVQFSRKMSVEGKQ